MYTQTNRFRCRRKNDIPMIFSRIMCGTYGFQVILGGGRQEFLPKMMNGNREDDKDLIAEWKMRMMDNHKRHDYVKNRTELLNVNLKNVDKLLGDYNISHIIL